MNKINGDIYRHVFQYNNNSYLAIGNIIPQNEQVPCYNLIAKTIELLSLSTIFDCEIVRNIERRDFQRSVILTSQYSQEARIIRDNLFSQIAGQHRRITITPKHVYALQVIPNDGLDKAIFDSL